MHELTDEQRMIRESVARFLADAYAFDKRQRIVASPAGFDTGHWRTFAELGLLAVRFPEAHGGLGQSLVEAGIICEQFGRFLVMSPFLTSSIVAGSALLLAGTPAQCDSYLPAMAEGRLIAAAALAEPRDEHSPFPASTRARATTAGFTLDGYKCLVPYATHADLLIVSALIATDAGDRAALFAVPAGSPGITMTPYRTYDGGRAADVELRSVRVDRGARLGDDADAGGALESMNDHACAMLVVEACGAMWSVHEQTLEYLKTREQFGQPLGRFQALQHRMVDVFVECQLAQSIAWDAVRAAASCVDPRDVGRRVSAAKVQIGAAGRRVGKEGVQLHGGIGMTHDVPIGHYLKRLTAIDTLHGDSHVHLDRFAALDAH